MSANDDTILARLKTQNVRQFVSEIGQASGAILGFGVANEEAAAKTKLSWIEQRAMQQGLYTTRRYLFWTTTALGGLITASAKAGITFDENKQQAIDAFGATLGSVQAARREVQLLTADTHATGVQLGDIAQAAETMQSFGITVKDTNAYVFTLANYAERAHVSFGSLVEIFDRIKQKGSFSSLDMRTLTTMGIPALQIFRKELGLTNQQVALLQAGKLIIPAQYALPALERGLSHRADVLGTNIGQQLGVTHSWLSQIFGTGESQTGLFGFVTKGLQRINGLLGRAARGQQTGGTRGMLQAIDPSGRLLGYFNLLASGVTSAADAIGFMWHVTSPLRITVGALVGGFSFLATNTGILTWGLKALALWWVVSRTRMLAFVAAEKAVAGATWAVGVAEDAYIASLYAYDLAVAIFTGDTIAATAALTALNLAFLANPITWIIIGVAALGVGMYLLVTRVHAVRDAFVYAFKDVKVAVADAFNWIAKGWNKLHFHVGGFSVFGHHTGGFNDGVSPIPLLPLLAGGGDVYPGGYAISGEAGPELLRNVGGVTRVMPLNRGAAPQGGWGDIPDRIAAAVRDALDGVAVDIDGRKADELITRARTLKAATT